MMAAGLRDEGFAVDVRPPGGVRRLDAYDAVILAAKSGKASECAKPRR
jgi:menaquinone-dependent protoporphyrinogen IX oxidase